MFRFALTRFALAAATLLPIAGNAFGAGNDMPAEFQAHFLAAGTAVGASQDIPAEFQGTWGYVSEDTDFCKSSEFSKVDHVFKIDSRRIQELEHACEVLEVIVPFKDENMDTQKRIDVRLRCSGEEATWEGSGSLVIQDAPNGSILVAAMSDAKMSTDKMVGYRASDQPAIISIARRCQM